MTLAKTVKFLPLRNKARNTGFYVTNLSQCQWTKLPYEKAQGNWMDKERKSIYLLLTVNNLIPKGYIQIQSEKMENYHTS